MTKTAETEPQKKTGRGRTIAVALLLVVACVLAPLSVLAVWTKNTLLDQDQYVSTVAPLAKNQEIITAAATQLTASIVNEKSVAAKVRDALPPRADFIAPAVATAVETLVNRVTLRILSSERFQTVWERANARAHTQVVNVLTGKGSRTVTTNNGEVAVNLGPVVERVQKRLSALGVNVLSAADAKRISPRFVLVQSDELKSAQTATDLLQKGAIVLPIVTLLLFAAAIAISRHRRKTVLHAGLGLAVGMFVILIAFNVGRAFYLDAVKAANHDAAAAVYDQVLNFLRLSARTGVVIGILIAIGAWLAGPSSAAIRLRSMVRGGEDRQLATEGFPGWVARSRTGIRIAIIALGAIVLFLWNHPKPVTVLVVALLVVIGIVVAEVLARGSSAPSAPSEAT